MTAVGATLTLRSHAPEVTQAMGGAVAAHLQPGDLVALTGELGAGKTCFVQGAAAALGVAERVKSPSFMLRRDYEGRIGITHLDVYRLETLGEVRDLGHDDPGQEQRITFIEWGDAIRPLLPADHLEVEFRLPGVATDGRAPAGQLRGGATDDAQAEPRTVVLRAHGPVWLRRIDDLRRAFAGWAGP